MVSIDLDISLFIQMANFIFMVIALNYVLYRPIRGILRKRADKIGQLNQEIEANTAGARAKAEELQARLEQAKREGAQLREELKDQAREQQRRMIEEATREMEEAVARIREQVAKEITQAREQLKAEVQAFGRQLAEKILGRSIQ